MQVSKETIEENERYKKIACDDDSLELFFIREFVRYAKRKKLKKLVLDADATDIPLHGKQEGRFYHGYYGHYCYLPLYIFCEENSIDFILGLARNNRLQAELTHEMNTARLQFEETKAAARVFKDFQYETIDTWSRKRRVIGKAEYLAKGENPRFIVTSLKGSPRELYEESYCKRGEAENCIKEQFQLFAHRTSSSVKRANQLRLWFSTLAYLVIVLFKKSALAGTELANAEPNTIRLKLLKIAVKITVSARRVYLSFAESFALQKLFYSALKATS